jgi:hypothetical protein
VSKFAAKFGLSRRDLSNDQDLHRRVMVQYAKSHGHDPTGLRNWTMVVSDDGEVTFYPFARELSPGNFDQGWGDCTPPKNPPDLLD